jgi:hypothetical protein
MTRCSDPQSIDTDLDCAIHVGMQIVQTDLEKLLEMEETTTNSVARSSGM